MSEANSIKSNHENYISQCLQLAILGAGYVSPNPMVGSILVHENKIIGKGYHQQYGQAHAEVNCLASVNENERNLIPESTLYVSLEPCSHFGKTPPCVDLILKHQIKKVVVACKDISSKVNGQGIDKLRANGVEVIEHILEEKAIEINKRFFTFHIKQRPYIILKWAESKEGYIGNEKEPIKLSNKVSDKIVHQWRAEEDAIWIGFNTLQIDNPQLNVRHVKGKNPIRIVYDKYLDYNPTHHFFDQSQPSFIFNHEIAKDDDKCSFIKIEKVNYIQSIINYLFKQNILSVIIEGGRQLIQEFIDLGLWDEARCIKTPTSLSKGIKAPELKHEIEFQIIESGSDNIHFYKRNLE